IRRSALSANPRRCANQRPAPHAAPPTSKRRPPPIPTPFLPCARKRRRVRAPRRGACAPCGCRGRRVSPLPLPPTQPCSLLAVLARPIQLPGAIRLSEGVIISSAALSCKGCSVFFGEEPESAGGLPALADNPLDSVYIHGRTSPVHRIQP